MENISSYIDSLLVNSLNERLINAQVIPFSSKALINEIGNLPLSNINETESLIRHS